MTLTELLTVIAIIALIGSLGAGAYQAAYRQYSLTASAGRVQGVLRAARNTAVSTGTPSFVVVDPVARTVAAYSYETVGSWNFDERSGEEGGLVIDRGRNEGGGFVRGRFGRGFDASSGGHYVCGRGSRFDLRTAVSIEAWVRYAAQITIRKGRLDDDPRRGVRRDSRTSRGRVSTQSSRQSTTRRRPPPREETATKSTQVATSIVEKNGAYFLGMTAAGALEGSIGKYRLRTADGVITPNRWVYVSLRYDGREIELSADGVPRPTKALVARPRTGRRYAAKPGEEGDEYGMPKSAPVSNFPLTISSAAASFPGQIDEVKLGGNVEPLTYAYSDFEHIVGWKKIVHFDRHGHLDARFHSEATRIVFVELPDGADSHKRTTVAVRFDLTFEDWLATFSEPPDLRQSKEEAKVEATYAKERKVVIHVDRLGVSRSEEL